MPSLNVEVTCDIKRCEPCGDSFRYEVVRFVTTAYPLLKAVEARWPFFWVPHRKPPWEPAEEQLNALYDAIQSGTPLHMPYRTVSEYAVFDVFKAGLAHIKEPDGSITTVSNLKRRRCSRGVHWERRSWVEYVREDGTVAFETEYSMC